MPRPVPKRLTAVEKQMTLDALRRRPPSSSSEYMPAELIRDAEYERLAVRRALEVRKAS